MNTALKKGKFVEFVMPYPYGGFRIGRVARINSNRLTVAICPYGLAGKKKGKRIRIPASNLTGILRGKRVIKLKEGRHEKHNRKNVARRR